MNQQRALAPNRTYDLEAYGVQRKVAFLGDISTVHDEPIHLFYSIRMNGTQPTLVISHIMSHGFITDGQTITMVNHETKVQPTETIYGLDKESLREDKRLSPLLARLKQAGLAGVPA